ncbi:MAG: phage Gp37/Gp68 family protein [bacterium]
MAEKSKIAWTDATWNPWSGCTPVSEGCDHCYMYREKRQFGQDPFAVVRSSDKTFYAPLKWEDPRFVFACSWGDFFHPAADAWRPEAWDVIRQCPQHTWLLLTKRPELVAARLPDDWPYPHVALGITAENQRRFDECAYEILAVPAALHFLSGEPLLGPVNTAIEGDIARRLAALGHLGNFDWYIVGSESGPGARPTHPDWVRALRDQAVAAGVPFNFKQWGESIPVGQQMANGVIVRRHGDDEFVLVGKKNAGRYLDGEIWDERPAPLGCKGGPI